MSCVQLDGSHTRCRQKGESTGYQARKKSVITNSIFLCDNKGQMIAMRSPQNGEQPDVYFDEELYKNRFKIEQANGWLDGYKGLIMRYEYLDVTWIGMFLLGLISKFLKKSLNTFVVKNVNQTDKITVNLF